MFRAAIRSGLSQIAHGKSAGAEDIGPLHAGDGRKPWLDDPHQIVGDLVLLEDVGGEAQVGRGELAVGRFDVDYRHFGLRRQVPPHLVDLGADLGQGLGGVVVEFQPHLDGGESQTALGLHVLDAVGGGDGPLQRRGDKTPHQFGVGADINGGDGNCRILAAGILANIQGADGLQAGDDDHQIDHQCQDGTPDEEIGNMSSSGSVVFRLWCLLELGRKLVVDDCRLTVASLKTPVLTTVSPSFRPVATATKSPRFSPRRTNCCRSTRPAFRLSFHLSSSTMKTESL